MQIDRQLIEKVAKNARLKLTEQEIKEFLPELKDIIAYFSEIEKAPTSNLLPSFHPIEIKNITREDIPKEGLKQEEALQNTKHKQDGYFKGPKTI
ncbi:Asp-tRNA(Asn)/Glu-tRNA(Gln) amidotransferase subunit GatC [Candidatus Woesearchaeota archaeon]|nr:Asp-tRNA(Asn)/Glu-tRNA(Gln) amidotransferase subunit GatC [Candidatus Woesearchaeota archaeon]